MFEIDLETFRRALACENHTLKRALTDPRLFSGIGNAYSDEILHRARLSPVAMTAKLSAEETARLYEATRATLADWIDRLRAQYCDDFPEKGTAFRPDMAVHGKYRQPCPVCGTTVQRSATPTTRPTTARAVRPVVSCWPIAPSRACCGRTGPGPSTSSSASDSPEHRAHPVRRSGLT